MTVHSFTAAPSHSTDTNFRAWAQAHIAALLAVGMVQTADTGQIDTATATAPTTALTSGGYAIFRFNDTLQATFPLFFRIDFYTGTYASNVAGNKPHLRVILGKGSDGAGTITVPLLDFYPGFRDNSNISNNGSTEAFPGVASGGEGYVALLSCISRPMSTYNAAPAFVIERTNSGSGVMVLQNFHDSIATSSAVANNLNLDASLMPFISTINYATGAKNVGLVPVNVPYSVAGSAMGPSSALAAGTLGPVFPWVVFAPGLAPHQSVAAMSYPGGDAPTGTFEATVGGELRNFYAVPLSDAHNSFGICAETVAAAVSRYVGLAIRWEA